MSSDSAPDSASQPLSSLDLGYTVERCEKGVSASIALYVGKRDPAYHHRERFWREQLSHAKRRERLA